MMLVDRVRIVGAHTHVPGEGGHHMCVRMCVRVHARTRVELYVPLLLHQR